jgi:hypothetical protein
MAQAAGDMAALGGLAGYDIRPFVTDAAVLASNAKRSGLPLARMAEQRDMAMPDEANDIAAMFARYARGPRRIGDALRSLARAALAEAEDEGQDMFGPKDKRAPAQLVREGMAAGAKGTGSLLDSLGELPADSQARIAQLAARLQVADPTERARLASEILALARSSAQDTARAYFRAELADTTVATVIGDVRIIGGTWKEMRRDMKYHAIKAALVPMVPEILRRGVYGGPEPLRKQRHDAFVAFHFFRLEGIRIGEVSVDAGVTVAERRAGELEFQLTAYGLGHSGDPSWQKRIGESLVRGQQPRDDPPIEPAEPPLDPIVPGYEDDGYIVILAVRELPGPVLDAIDAADQAGAAARLARLVLQWGNGGGTPLQRLALARDMSAMIAQLGGAAAAVAGEDENLKLLRTIADGAMNGTPVEALLATMDRAVFGLKRAGTLAGTAADIAHAAIDRWTTLEEAAHAA